MRKSINSIGKRGIEKKVILVVVMLLFVFAFTGCGNSNSDGGNTTMSSSSTSSDEDSNSSTESSASSEDNSEESTGGYGMHHVEINVKDYGTIKLELDGDTAPITVENFINLANDGFYNGLTFHRIMDGFMIQGGDPQGNGFGGSDQTIKGEFAANGVENNISHKKGVISMARSQNPNSASSQFFITVADSEFLDGNYAAFGIVTEGQDVADKIASDAQPIDNNGTIPAENQPVITEIVVVD